MPSRSNQKPAESVQEEKEAAWRRQAVDRSLQGARARVLARSDRFVAAATEILRDRGTTEFTVQEVVDRSGMSIRTFYKYFGSKEDLLVAVSETVVAREAVPRLREHIEAYTDPLRRLEAFVLGLFEISIASRHPAARTLASYQNRLAETRPADLALAMAPQLRLLEDLIADVARTQPLRPGLSEAAAAGLVHRLLLSTIHAHLFSAKPEEEADARSLWEFCAAGIGLDDASRTRDRSR